MTTKIGFLFLGISVGMVFIDGQYLAAAIGCLSSLFFLGNHLDDDQEGAEE